jgi:hypothetical protein
LDGILFPLQLIFLFRGYLHFLGNTSATSKTTGTAGSDETDLLTGRRISLDCGSVIDMLMITTTVRMLNGIHVRPASGKFPVGT